MSALMSLFQNRDPFEFKPTPATYIHTSQTTHITQLDGYYQGNLAFGDHFTVDYGRRRYHHGWMRNRFTGNLYWYSDIDRYFTPDAVRDIFHHMIADLGQPKLSTSVASASVAGRKSRKETKKSLKYKKKSSKHSKKSLNYKKKSRKETKKSLKYKKKLSKQGKKSRKSCKSRK